MTDETALGGIMPIKIHSLDKESKNILKEWLLRSFLDGECYAFAEALNEGLGWPMYGLIQEDRVVRHAVLKLSDTMFFDARGEISASDLFKPFGHKTEFEIEEITSADLARDGESKEVRLHSIATARKFAEAIWPNLPWKDSLAKQVSKYLAALEEIDEIHGFCIRAPYPAARPVVEVRHGDETGYAIRLTEDGQKFTFDRTFKC